MQVNMDSAPSNEAVHEHQSQMSRDIDRMLLNDKKDEKHILKLLMLGPTDSGKSTIVKQIRMIHGRFSDEEMLEKRLYVYSNVLAAVIDVLQAVDRLRLVFKNTSSFGDAREVTARYDSQKTSGRTELPSNMVEAIKRLLEDKTIQECLERTVEYGIDENTIFFLSNVERLTLKDYNPTIEDILKCRVPTSGVDQFSFAFRNSTFNKIDLFKEKIKHTSIKVALQDYEGPREYRPSLDYIAKEFAERNKNKKRNVCTHEICATETKHMQVVIDTVVKFVIQQVIDLNLERSGMMK